MKKKPILTIAIPTWNRADILNKALANLMPQLEKNKDLIELVISDNGSDDNTDEVIKSYLGKYSTYNIVHYRQAENTGYYGNFKTCRKLSNGDYFWLLSDNDYVANGLIDYIFNILAKEEPSFIFLRDWKHSAEVKADSRFSFNVYSVKDGLEKFNFKTTLISAVVFNNDKSKDSNLFDTFNGNTFLGFAYFLQSLSNRDKAYEILGTSLFINDTKVSFNAFKSFGVDLMACLYYAKDQKIISEETLRVFVNEVISGLTVKHYILYRVTGSLHGRRHTKKDVDQLINQGFAGFKSHTEKLKPLQDSSGLAFYYLVIRRHLLNILKERISR